MYLRNKSTVYTYNLKTIYHTIFFW